MTLYGYDMNICGYVADIFGVPEIQVIFLITQILSVPLAVIFRTHLSPSHTTCTTRHTFGATVGLILLYWCFGWSLLHMLLQCLGVYAILNLLPSHINHKLAFVFCMGYLLYIQINRMFYVNNRHIFEISFPMMMSTQKLTSLAFSIHDGVHKKRELLKPMQKKYALSKYPALIEVLGYTFHFSGLICGPSFFFQDYVEFISGTNQQCKDHEIFTNGHANSHQSHNNCVVPKICKSEKPDPTREVIRKLCISAVCLGIHLGLGSRFPTERNGDSSFIYSHGFFYRFCYLNLSMMLARYQYYFAWLAGEAIQNASGLGLHYVNGNPQWDLITNVNIMKLDFPTSLKEYADNWNICTTRWLRLVSYERTGKYRLLFTYTLSALWHGVEPGYYVTFISAVIATLAARKVRKTIRPHFLDTRWKVWYDIVTGLSAHIAIYYGMGGFHVLHLERVLEFYTYSMYWYIHVLAFLIFIIPVPSRFIKVTKVA